MAVASERAALMIFDYSRAYFLAIALSAMGYNWRAVGAYNAGLSEIQCGPQVV